MKESCKNCINCDVNDEAAAKTELIFPDDHGCIMGYDEWPDEAHHCMGFIDGRPFWKTEASLR